MLRILEKIMQNPKQDPYPKQGPDTDLKPTEKQDPDPNTDPTKIIPDPQHTGSDLIVACSNPESAMFVNEM